MLRIRRSAFRLLLPCLLCAALPSCDDDDNNDGGDESVGDAGGGSDGSDGDESGNADDSGDDGQGRSVYACEVRVVCQDGSVTEAGQPLCLTAAEAASEIGMLGELCIEDMTLVCEDIADGSSLECGAECTDLEEACSCDDPARGCAI